MTRRSALFLILILGLFLGGVITLGIRIARDEKRFIQAEHQELLRKHLETFAEKLLLFTRDYDQTLRLALNKLSQNSAQARSTIFREPLVNQYFQLDSRGRLVYPNPQAKDLSETELRFIERTREIWEGKRLTAVTLEESRYPELKSSRSENKPAIWYPYYWNDGFHLLFALGNETGLSGFELNSARFTADLMNFLAPSSSAAPDSSATPDDAALVLMDPTGRIIHQSHANWQKEGRELVYSSLPEPFSSWKLVAIDSTISELGRAAYFNIISAMILFVSALLVLGGLYLQAQRRELKEAAQRVNFVNQVSHELKTPLTNIRMYAELLGNQLDDSEERAKHHARVIVSESERLGRLIGNVLTFAGSERRKLKLNRRRTSLKSALEETIEHFRPSLAEKEIEVQYRFSGEDEVFADSDLFQQIASNLISNVEKYAGSGHFLGLELKCSTTETVLTVTDRGPGIPKMERARLFEPFYRVSNKLTDGVSGAGIGLTIVRELATLHGGSVRLLETKVGAAFEVQLSTAEV